jgi:hypothetical protein
MKEEWGREICVCCNMKKRNEIGFYVFYGVHCNIIANENQGKVIPLQTLKGP